jgi:hypothetical protein
MAANLVEELNKGIHRIAAFPFIKKTEPGMFGFVMIGYRKPRIAIITGKTLNAPDPPAILYAMPCFSLP